MRAGYYSLDYEAGYSIVDYMLRCISPIPQVSNETFSVSRSVLRYRIRIRRNLISFFEKWDMKFEVSSIRNMVIYVSVVKVYTCDAHIASHAVSLTRRYWTDFSKFDSHQYYLIRSDMISIHYIYIHVALGRREHSLILSMRAYCIVHIVFLTVQYCMTDTRTQLMQFIKLRSVIPFNEVAALLRKMSER